MARVSKTSPFRPRGQTQPKSNNEGEKQDEEKSSSSGNSENDTQDQQEKTKGKRPMQAKMGNRKTTQYERIGGPARAERIVRRGKGKSIPYTVGLWCKHNLKIDVHVSSDEPKNANPKPKITHDEKQAKAKGKRPMQAKKENQRTTLAKGIASKRGRRKPTSYTLRLWRKDNSRSPQKGIDVHPENKEENDQTSETHSDKACKKIKIERYNNDDIDDDGRGAGTHRSLTSLGIEVGK